MLFGVRCNQEKECVNEDWRETERGEGKIRVIAERCGEQIACCASWTCYNRTKLRETQQNQGFALI